MTGHLDFPEGYEASRKGDKGQIRVTPWFCGIGREFQGVSLEISWPA